MKEVSCDYTTRGLIFLNSLSARKSHQDFLPQSDAIVYIVNMNDAEDLGASKTELLELAEASKPILILVTQADESRVKEAIGFASLQSKVRKKTKFYPGVELESNIPG
jgi:hypothetical protein